MGKRGEMTFTDEFSFAEKHMPEVKKALGNLPSKIFFDIDTATVKRDMEEATDLIMSVSSGDIAVRVRRNKFLCYMDWSVRVRNKGYKTEIHKLQEGYARWYFIGWSLDDKETLAKWYLLDLDKIRAKNILTRDYPIRDNYDGTAGKYIPIKILSFNMCVAGQSQP
jgi:hypothetical protein